MYPYLLTLPSQSVVLDPAADTFLFDLIFLRVEKGAGGREHYGRTHIDLYDVRWMGLLVSELFLNTSCCFAESSTFNCASCQRCGVVLLSLCKSPGRMRLQPRWGGRAGQATLVQLGRQAAKRPAAQLCRYLYWLNY